MCFILNLSEKFIGMIVMKKPDGLPCYIVPHDVVQIVSKISVMER